MPAKFSPIVSGLRHLRRTFWHARKGGIAQVRKFLHTSSIERQQAALYGVQGAEGVWTRVRGRRQLIFRDARWKDLPDSKTEFSVGVILDDFSAAAFHPEWNAVYLDPGYWLHQIQTSQPDMIFIESAWNGNGGIWKSKIAGQSGPSQILLDLLEYCRKVEIPTVFWNKEDPPHYLDFLPAARHFDFVFTSDSRMIERYRADLGHDRIDALLFAAQPKIHNPVRPQSGWHERGIAFAGMYFAHKFPERRLQMNYLLPGARNASRKLEVEFDIFSRQLNGAPEYQFPEPFDRSVVGSLNYGQMLTAYKAYKVFLNVNSVVDSPSMCARRIFEIAASGTTIVTTPSVAVSNLFAEGTVPIVSTEEESELVIRSLIRNPDLAERRLHVTQRNIWQNHTYKKRVDQIKDVVFPDAPTSIFRPQISLLVSSFRPHQMKHVFEMVAGQLDVDIQLLFLGHGFSPKVNDFTSMANDYGIADVQLLGQPTSTLLGDCLNQLVQSADGLYSTKWDDDDYYGPNYLFDMTQAHSFSGADIVGKQAHYMYLEKDDVTVLRNATREHRFTNMVSGPTIFGKTDIFRNNSFKSVSRGEDTGFLESVTRAGGSIYSSDRFNYCQMRSRDTSSHTWSISDLELLSASPINIFGRPEEQITI